MINGGANKELIIFKVNKPTSSYTGLYTCSVRVDNIRIETASYYIYFYPGLYMIKFKKKFETIIAVYYLFEQLIIIIIINR